MTLQVFHIYNMQLKMWVIVFASLIVRIQVTFSLLWKLDAYQEGGGAKQMDITREKYIKT